MSFICYSSKGLDPRLYKCSANSNFLSFATVLILQNDEWYLRTLIKIVLFFQEITFGDFDNLTQEDEVYQILYGPRQAEGGGVEVSVFPHYDREC